MQLACRSHGYTASWQRKLNVTWLAICVFVAPLCFMTLFGYKITRAVWHTSSPDSNGTCGPLMRRNTSSNFNQLNKRTMLSQAKMKTIQLTVCILLAHFCCWTPYFSVNLMNVWTDYKMKEEIPRAVGIVAQSAAWLSSCINPLIYGFFHMSVEKLKKACTCCRETCAEEQPTTPPQFRVKFGNLDGSSGATGINGERTPRRTITLSTFSDRTKLKMKKSSYSLSGDRLMLRSPSTMVKFSPTALSLDMFVPKKSSVRSA